MADRRLGDILVRAAFKHQADRQLELGAGGGSSAAQVFEVRDLFIPSGTDWPENVIDTSIELPLAGGFLYSLYLELAAAPDVDQILLRASLPAGFSDNVAVAGADVQGATSNFDIALSTQDGSLDDPQVVSVILSTPSGPTSAAITVVRARAAFLVI